LLYTIFEGHAWLSNSLLRVLWAYFRALIARRTTLWAKRKKKAKKKRKSGKKKSGRELCVEPISTEPYRRGNSAFLIFF